MKIEKLIVMMAMSAVLTGCADKEVVEPAPVAGDSPVAVGLAFSMPDVAIAKTRMADSVVQTSYEKFRGLKDVRIIPFKVGGPIMITHVPFVFDAYGSDERGRVTGKPSKLTPAAYYYYPDCAFWSGTASVLFYGRGANTVEVAGKTIPASDKSYYGSTVTNYPDANSPARIQFSPEQIRWSAAPANRAKALADYMTAIANTPGWATTEDSKLKALYLDFIRQDDGGNYAVIAGSSASIRAFLKEMYDEVGLRESDDALATAIRSKIETGAKVELDNQGKVVSVTLHDDLLGPPISASPTALPPYSGMARPSRPRRRPPSRRPSRASTALPTRQSSAIMVTVRSGPPRRRWRAASIRVRRPGTMCSDTIPPARS